MEPSEIISLNLKQLRSEKKLSLDNVAKMTGVSKSMLGQIERGEVSPSITTIWKLTNGLKVSFTTLLNRPQADIEIVTRDEAYAFIEDNGKFRNYSVFPFDETRRFEIYNIEMDASAYLSAEPHPAQSQEYISVFSGELTIMVKDEEFTLKTGESIRFKADVPHAYHNAGKVTVNLSMVIYYPE